MKIITIINQAKKIAGENNEIYIKDLAKKLDARNFNWCETASNQMKWFSALESLKEEGFDII